MHYCLSKDELSQLLDLKADNIAIESDDLRGRVDLAENWHDSLGALTYLFSHILERGSKSGDAGRSLIQTFYNLPESMYLNIQELDANFVEYMLANIRDKSLDLEDELVGLQNRMSEYDYERTLRY